MHPVLPFARVGFRTPKGRGRAESPPRRSRVFWRRLPVWLALGIALLTAGCAHVEPWERGKLADYTMRADRDPLYDAFMEHTFFSREAASGGRGVGGGGCGCN